MGVNLASLPPISLQFKLQLAVRERQRWHASRRALSLLVLPPTLTAEGPMSEFLGPCTPERAAADKQELVAPAPAPVWLCLGHGESPKQVLIVGTVLYVLSRYS